MSAFRSYFSDPTKGYSDTRAETRSYRVLQDVPRNHTRRLILAQDTLEPVALPQAQAWNRRAEEDPEGPLSPARAR